MALVACTTALPQNLAPPSTAEVLLKQMIAKYRSVQTYSDSGTSVYGDENGGTRPRTNSFTTHFERPASLRLEMWFVNSDDTRRGTELLWADERAIHKWSANTNRLDTLAANDLYRARWYFPGPGPGPAYYIPALLNERYADQHFLDLARLTIPIFLPEEVIENAECYHVNAKSLVGQDYQVCDLWIGKHDLMIHKLSVHIATLLHEEVRRDIRVDAELPKDIFQATPPQ